MSNKTDEAPLGSVCSWDGKNWIPLIWDAATKKWIIGGSNSTTNSATTISGNNSNGGGTTTINIPNGQNSSGVGGGTYIFPGILGGGWIGTRNNTIDPQTTNEEERPTRPDLKKAIVGCRCKHCNEFNEYASPNCPDDSFLCYGCRSIWK